jgi:predicted trehalose synthase
MAREIAPTDLLKYGIDQQTHAFKIYGVDQSSLGKSAIYPTRYYPATTEEYAAEVFAEWLGFADQAMPQANRSELETFAKKENHDAISVAAFSIKLAGDIQWAWLRKTGDALHAMHRAIASARDTGGGRKRLDGAANAQFWDAVKKASIELGSLSVRVTATEKWSAFKEGAIEGVENVGKAASAVVEKTAEIAGGAAGGLLKGLGATGIAFAVIAVLAFKYL